MKVAELCISPDLGGLELYMLRVVRWMANAGIPHLAVIGAGSKLESAFRAEALRYRRLRVLAHRFPLLAARRLARWLDSEEVDLIHLHWANDLTLAVLARRFAARTVRIVYTRHMTITRRKHDWYHRAQYRHVDRVLAITRRIQEQAWHFLPLPRERVQLLYHGVPALPPPSPGEAARLRERAGVPSGRFVVGLIGRIEPGKGQHVLLDAVAMLTQRGCDVHAVLVGHPMHPRHLRALRVQASRLGISDRVYYYGFHPRPQELMRCMDCVVLTTFAEHFGLVLIEAMRVGVAVIGTNAGGVPEIIDDMSTGLLIPPGSPPALADAIERLVRDSAFRSRLARAGKAVADARFDEERHFALLQRCLIEVGEH